VAVTEAFLALCRLPYMDTTSALLPVRW